MPLLKKHIWLGHTTVSCLSFVLHTVPHFHSADSICHPDVMLCGGWDSKIQELITDGIVCFVFYRQYYVHLLFPPQWGAADAEIKVPSGENTELKRSPFQAWSMSVYSHSCYAYCRGVLPCLFLPFQSIHLHFFQNLSQFFSCVGLQNKIGHPAGCMFPCWVPAAYK